MKNFNMKIIMSVILLTSFAAQAVTLDEAKKKAKAVLSLPFDLKNWQTLTSTPYNFPGKKKYVVGALKFLPFLGDQAKRDAVIDTDGKTTVRAQEFAKNRRAKYLVNTTMNLAIIGCCVYTAKKQIYDRFIAKKLTKLEQVQEDIKETANDVVEAIKS